MENHFYYLLWVASKTASALNQAMDEALTMEDEGSAILTLEKALENTPALASFNKQRGITVRVDPEFVDYT